MTPGKRGTPPRSDRSASVRGRHRDGEGHSRRSRGRGRRPSWPARPGSGGSPRGGLPGQPKDDRHRAVGDARSTWAVGIGPVAPDQVPVPPKQGLRLHEEPTSTSSVHESTQTGEQGSILRLQGRPNHLATEHGNLVTEHDYLDRQLLAITSTEAHQLEDPGEGEVEEREGHGPVSSSSAISGKSWSRCPDDIVGTDRSTALFATASRA